MLNFWFLFLTATMTGGIFIVVGARELPFGPGRTGIYERTEECVGAQRFHNETISVTFTKIDKRMLLSIKMKNVTDIPSSVIPTECLRPNTTWGFHIHEKSEIQEKVGLGNAVCSTDAVGDHWDPTLACGPHSGNVWCKRLPLPPSSSIPKEFQQPLRKYACNPEIYTNGSVYACELGDFSNKYFSLVVPPWEATNEMDIAVDIFDPRDVLPTCELGRKSLVLHCNNTKILCMMIEGTKQPISFFYNALREEAPNVRRYHSFLSEYYSLN